MKTDTAALPAPALAAPRSEHSLEKAPPLAAFDYCRTEPCIVKETAQWAVVYKPPQLPTAPLRADEQNTLVYWFLQTQAARNPEQDFSAQPYSCYTQADAAEGLTQRAYTADIHTSPAAQVRGKKAIEAGLLHRLDTGTRGLVLFAKTQACYDFLSARQDAGELRKTYYAFTAPYTADPSKNTAVPVCIPQRHIPAESIAAQLPFSIASQFRNFGPGAKRVAPVFAGSRQYKEGNRLYTTVVEGVDIIDYRIDCYPLQDRQSCTPVLSGSVPQTQQREYTSPTRLAELNNPVIRGFRCSLTRGYRHQVRVHLASLGYPIIGDPLYAEASSALPGSHDHSTHQSTCLQLYAIGLSFPDLENPQQNISVVLPPPDKMNP